MDFLQNKQIKLLIYVSKIIFPRYHCCSFPLYMFVHYYKIKKLERTYSLNETDILFIHELSIALKENITDQNNTVIVNNIYLRGVEFGLLTVRFGNKLLRRYVRLLVSDAVPEETVIISTPLMYNLTKKLEITNSQSDIKSLKAQIFCSSAGRIDFAEEIELALINNPSDFDNSIIDNLLNNYFRKPKLIKESDIIEINVKHYLQGLLCNVSKIMNYSNSIYFKCIKILPKNRKRKHSYFVVKGETTLKQAPNIQNFIPPKTKILTEGKFINGAYTKKWEGLPNCPYGLETYASQIEKAIRIFLKKGSNPASMKVFDVHPSLLLIGKKGTGKELLISRIAAKLGMHFYRVINFDLAAQVYAQSETKLKNLFFNAKLCAPCILYIKDFENFEKNQEGKRDERIISHFESELHGLFENNKYPVILICSTNDDSVYEILKRNFKDIFEINPPTEEERIKNLEWLLEYENIPHNVDLPEIAQKTNSFLYGDLNALVQKAKSLHCIENKSNVLNNESFTLALNYMQKYYHQSIGTPKVPKVQWDDVGGLTEVKNAIIKIINLPQNSPELVKPTFGILLFGPPGTGKTLLAKAVATECNLCFLSVKGPELLNMYIGQSEANIREVFSRARAASPCIIFFDELDSLAPKRGASGDSAGVMDRMVSQFLTEMDGINEKGMVFVIGATNRPDLIDPALLRRGRFDQLLYVGPSMDFNSRLSVLKALTRKFNLDKELDLEEIIKICPDNISGADFYGICSNSWSNAVRRSIHECENGTKDADSLTANDVIINFEDFKYALETVTPSISKDDLEYFEKLRREIETNAIH